MQENKLKIDESQVAIYEFDNHIQLDVRMENETLWLTQAQIADLFGVKQPAISKHLSNIYKSGELEERNTYSISEYMGNDDKQRYQTKYYNLDAILSVGYRVNSKRATAFRQWANRVLKDYLLKGYAINQNVLIKISELTDKVGEHDQYIKTLYDYLKSFDEEQKRRIEWEHRKPIGFK